MYWSNYGWGWGMGFGWFFMVIFWVLVILGIVYLIKVITGIGKKEEKEETAIDILNKRYAKGEISKEEFDRMKEDLRKD